jgi:hypothetical protein
MRHAPRHFMSSMLITRATRAPSDTWMYVNCLDVFY